MATYEQLPGTLNLSLRRGDDLSVSLDFDINLSGVLFTATVHSVIDDTQVVAMTTTVTSAANGTMTVSLTDSQTAGLAYGTYAWRLVGESASVTKTYLAGYMEVIQ